MIVMKFGGTSIANAERIERVFSLVQAESKRQPIVVVSAHAGVTDLLLSAALSAKTDDTVGFAAIEQRHHELLKSLGLAIDLLDPLLKELHELLRGIHLVQELTARTKDFVVSFGERMSSAVIANYFSALGLDAQAVNAFDVGFVTDSNFGQAVLLPGQDKKIRNALASIDKLPVVTGFIAKNSQGDMTTLGRSGSDTTAAIIGGALQVEEIQIWTDVDGVMTADPSLIKEAKSIPRMSFAEAAELAYFGAKVLHPDCLRPALENNVPVRVLNTYRPESMGTLLSNEIEEDAPQVRAVAYKESQVLLNIVSSRMLMNYGFMANVFEIFERFRIAVHMISTSEVSLSLLVSSMDSMEDVVRELSHFSEVTVKKNRTIVCVVGGRMREARKISGKVFEAMGQAKIPVEMISLGASKINISFVIDDAMIERAVPVLHELFFSAE